MQTLKELQDSWVDEPNYHKQIHESFCELVNGDEQLKDHRDFVEQNAFGFGERSFHWLWKLLVDEMPNEFDFLEIGVFRGSSLSLFELLANKCGKIVYRWGLTPLDSTDGHWESDYRSDIKTIHEKFGLEKSYNIFEGLSTDNRIMACAYDFAPYDIIYIDGGHTTEVITSDLKNYCPMVKVGGYLAVDDSCNDMDMPFGFFQGIQPVTDAVLSYDWSNWEFICNVVHLRIMRRIK